MEIINTIKTDTNGNILDCHQIHYRGDVVRDEKKKACLETKNSATELVNTHYSQISLELQSKINVLNEKLLIETDTAIITQFTADIAALTSQLQAATLESETRIAAINQTYLDACALADTEYTNRRLENMMPGFAVILNTEFAKIGSEKDLKLWDAATSTVIDKPTAQAARDQAANEKRIADIKRKAGEIINVHYPLNTGKQNNMIAHMTELLLTMQTVGSLTSAEQTELTELQAAWAWVKAVRETSNQAEISGTALTDIVWPA